jgi:uncharacterized protein YndB with AHSA1/START domain
MTGGGGRAVLKKLILAVISFFVAVPLLVMAVAATRPATFLVQRTIAISAPPASVYGAIVDFHRWERWSPWARLDPRQKTSMAGEGLGAVYTWSGDDKVGAGRMTIIEAVPDSKVAIRLEFQRPFESTNETSFLVLPDGSGSRLTWLMKGTHGLVGRAMSIVMDMDAMIGPDFEKGLAALKADLEHPRN